MEKPFETYVANRKINMICGRDTAEKLTGALFGLSASFNVEPYPLDKWLVSAKNEPRVTKVFFEHFKR
jgi:hypothetical protein